MSNLPLSSSPTPGASQDLRPENRWLLLLGAINFTNIVDFMVMMPLSPLLIRTLNITTTQFSILVSAYAIAACVSSLAMARIADRYDRKRALLVAYAGLTVGTLGCAIAPNYAALLLARTVAGLFGGVMSSIVMAMVGDRIPDARRGSAMARVMVSVSLSAVIGVPLSLYIAAHSSWRIPFAALSAACVVLCLVAQRTMPAMREHIRTEAPKGLLRGYIDLIKHPNHAWAMTMSSLIVLSGMMVIPFIAPTRIANEGMSEAQLSLFYIAGGFCSLFTRPLFAGITDRYPRANVLYWLVMGSAIPILLITHTLGAPLWLHVVISALFFVFVSGRFVPASAMVTAATTPNQRGRLMSLNSAAQNLAMGVASIVGGAMLTTHSDGHISGYDTVGYLAILIALGAVVAGYRVKRVS